MLLNPSPLFGISGICSLSPISGYSTALWTHCCCVFELPECCFANCCCSPATICITSGLPARAVEASRGRRTRWLGGGILGPMEGPRQRILGGVVSSEPGATWSRICTPLPSVCTTLCLANKQTHVCTLLREEEAMLPIKSNRMSTYQPNRLTDCPLHLPSHKWQQKNSRQEYGYHKIQDKWYICLKIWYLYVFIWGLSNYWTWLGENRQCCF